jgi:hypothetical protein
VSGCDNTVRRAAKPSHGGIEILSALWDRPGGPRVVQPGAKPFIASQNRSSRWKIAQGVAILPAPALALFKHSPGCLPALEGR